MNIPLEKFLELDKHKNIGVAISGGADSAILSYQILKIVQKPVHFFTFANECKHYRTIRTSSEILQTCNKLLNKHNNFYHHIKYFDNYDRNNFLNFLLESIDSKIVDVVYTATTSIPNKEIRDQFKIKLNEDIVNRRDSDKIKPLWSHNKKLCHPYVNLTKKEIYYMYKNFDLLDTLFPKTMSCESLEDISYHCGECWWCEERMWAFGKY